jgi:class 3 adenylate cyclase
MPEIAGERRHITVVFCDLVGSTGIAARLDAEEWRDLVGAYLDAASAAVTEMGGKVAKKLGDGLMALFGYPQAHEDDAERAVRAGLELVTAASGLKTHAALQTRMGIATGAVGIFFGAKCG